MESAKRLARGKASASNGVYMSIRTNEKRFAAHLPPHSTPILTSDERRGDEGPSMAALIRQVEAFREDRRRQRVEVRATVELCLRVNLSMVVYGE